MGIDIVGAEIEVDKITGKLKEIYILVQSKFGLSKIVSEHYFKYFVESEHEYIFVTRMINEAVKKTIDRLSKKAILN